MDEPLIAAAGLSRVFKETQAVDALDLEIRSGELFGLIGPDGAGKTTTLRLLAGLLDVSAGSARIAGLDLASQPEAIKPHIGYMAQQFSLYGELTVLENLGFFADIYNVPKAAFAGRRDRLLSFAGLADFKDRRAAHLSGGMQKKLALASTLIHEPEILLLDEPTTGVDPISRREFWHILNDLHLQGTTIIVSTPYMDEADRCSRVGLMYAGRLVICDTPKRIRESVPGEWLELRPQDMAAAQDFIETLDGVREVQTYGDRLNVRVDSAGTGEKNLRRALRKRGIPFEDLRPAPRRMEQAFISLLRQVEDEGE